MALSRMIGHLQAADLPGSSMAILPNLGMWSMVGCVTPTVVNQLQFPGFEFHACASQRFSQLE